MTSPIRQLFALFFLLALAACTEAELASHVAKSVAGPPQTQGTFKVGNPYKVEGQWYKPQETYNFTETGIASWYGPGFHGKRTANGEVFDMNELTAAHRTLQMPSLVRVTNLENGRALVVRVNDRGPFKRGRVIDVSKKAADLLGFRGKGTAKVRLELLEQESQEIAMAARRGMDTSGMEVAVNDVRLQPPPQAQYVSASSPQPVSYQVSQVQGHLRNGEFFPDPVVSQHPVTPTNIYVQTGSFSNQENAYRLAGDLGSYGRAEVYPAMVSGRQFYRVRIGPVASVDEADRLLSRVVSGGQPQAIIVVN